MIREYIKMKDDEFENIAENFQADPRQVQLLSIIGEQVKLLVDEGRPNLSSFFASLESNLVVTSEEASRLYADFGLETVSGDPTFARRVRLIRRPCKQDALPAGSLDADVDRLVEKARELLGKQEFGEYDCIMINGEVDFPCDSLHRLRPGRWLDMWSIAAAMEMTDKHRSVRYGLSVDLDEVKEDGVVPKLRPLGLWRKKVDQYRKKATGVPLIYFCPLNLNANHFTLLEINEQAKMIYHYDSMANRRIIQRKTKTSRVRQVVEVGQLYKLREPGANSQRRKSLATWGLGTRRRYVKSPASDNPANPERQACPQQTDLSSCGPMVARNARLRMNGLSVGSWESKVNPERLRKAMVELFHMWLDRALQAKANHGSGVPGG
jgi:hypothetical protein